MTRRLLVLLAISFAMLCASSQAFAQTCTGLCLQQTTCPGGGTTSVSGTVYAPNGTDPLPNVLVYVPNGTVQPFTDGPNCVNGGEPVTGSPLVSTISATDGTFTLTNMPVGANIPLVIQAGRWRRQVVISNVASCANTALPGTLVRFPQTKAEGDIPFIALVTGKVDQLECTLRKVGIADSEFTNPGGGGRINLYVGNAIQGGGGGAVIDANTPVETVLEGTTTSNSQFNSYDLAILSCEDNVPFPTAAQETNLSTFADAGGRVFASHFNYNWIESNTEYGGVATWATTPLSGSANGTVNTSFPKGAQLAQWLVDVGASTTLGTISLNAVRSDIATVVAPTQDWINLATGGNIQQITFNTPVGVPLANQCGRVLLLDYHVVDVPTSSPSKQIFPTECPTEATLTPQEKLVEYNLFDLENILTADTAPTDSLAITNSPAAFEQGDTADTISINVANTSATIPNTPGLTLKLTLPTGFSAVSLQGKNTNTGWTCNVANLTCTQTGGLAGGASDPITLTVAVSTAATPTLANGGAVVTGVLSGGGLGANVTGTDTIPVAGANTLTTSNATPAPGQTVIFTDTFPEVGTTVPTGTVGFYYGATLLGTTTTFTEANGVVTATLNYVVSTSQLPIGGPYAIQAKLSGSNYPNAVSNFVNETVGPYSSSGDTLTAVPATINLGGSTTATFSIPVVTGFTTAPTGSVTFSYPNFNGTTTTATATFAATATGGFWTATLSNITTLPAGKDTISANYPGDANYGATPKPLTAPVTVNPAPGSSDTLAANPSTITAGATTNVTFSIPVVPGFTTAPTGPVTITYPTASGTSSGTATFAASPTNGFWTATLSNVAGLPASTTPDKITSSYPGDANYGPGTPSTTVTVGPNSGVNDTLSANPASINTGGTTNVTFSIPVVSGLTTAPTGPVTITYPTASGTSTGTATFAATPTNGFWTATLANVAGLPANTTPDKITSSYPGDLNYGPATPSTTVSVGTNNGNGDTLTANPATISFGGSTNVTFSIPVVSGLAIAPTGSVTITYPVTTNTVTGAQTGTSSGTATFAATPTNGFWTATLSNVTGLPLGNQTITSSYAGDGNYGGATPSAAVTVNTAQSPNPTISCKPNPSVFGQLVTCQDVYPPLPGGGPVQPPSCPVQFYVNGTAVGAPINAVNGTATFTSTTLAAGSDQISGTMAACGVYSTTSTPPTTQQVNPASTTDTLTSSNTAPTYGQPVTFTDTIPLIIGAVPVGPVTFYNGTTSIGVGTPTSTPGVYTLTTSSLPVGPDPITAVLTADSNYLQSTSNVVNEQVAPVNTNPALSCTPTTVTVGQTVNCKDTNGPTGSPATCPVQLYVNGVAFGSPVVPVNGVANFSDSNLPAGTDLLSATQTACGVYATSTSNNVPVTVGLATPTDVLTTSNASPNAGQPVTLTDTITLINGIVPAGPVTFYNGSGSIGVGTPTATPGVYTLTTSALPAGTDPITAVLAADSTYAQTTSNVVTEQVGLINTNPTLSCTPTTATVGQTVNCKDTNGPSGSPSTCPVQLYVNGVAYGTPVVPVNGVANFSDSNLPAGTDLLSATQTACGVYATSTSNNVPVTVGLNTPNDVLTTSNPTPTSGQPVTLTDTITLVNGIVPAGPVTFYNGANPIGVGTPTSTPGVYTLTTSTLPVGADPITAVLSPDSTYAMTTSNVVTEQVGLINTNPTLSCTPTTATVGQTVNCKDTNGPSGSPATCPVQLYVNGVAYGAPVVPVNGVANFSDSNLPAGTDLLSATQTACGVYATSTSNNVPVTVGLNTPNDVLTTSNATPTSGQPVTFTDTITLVNGVVPTGPVTFYNGTNPIGTGTPTGTPGVYTLTTSTLPVGSDPITAVLTADSTYAQTTSNVVNEQVGAIITTPVLACSPNPSTVGQTVTCTNTNGPVSQPSNCPVQFYVNGVAYGPLVTPVNGVATFTDAALLPGTDIITAVVQACGNFGQTSPNPVNEIVNLYSPGDVLTSNNTNPSFGTPVTLTDTITLLNGIVPAGPVTFYNGTKAIGTGTPTSTPGVYTLTTSALLVGTNPITAVLSADSTYAQTTSNVVNEVVGPATNINDSLSSNNLTPTLGQAVTFTDTLTLVNGVVPTGAVTLYLGTSKTALGTMTATGTPGVYTLTTSALPAGSDPVYAILAADATYAQTQSNTITETVGSPDFAITATPANQTINPGYATSYQVSLSGVNAAFTSPVTLTATGLPPLATVSFANASLVPGTGPTSTTMTIQTSPIIAKVKEADQGGKIFYGLLLLPLLGLRKIRRKIKALPGGIAYLLMLGALLGGLGATIGCGGGYFGGPPQTYTITVTGTSGTLTHSTTVTLTVR